MSPDNKNLRRFGDFILDAEERVLTRAGKPVALTPKAFELLLVLVSGAGRIIEKETLMNEVWADSFVEESNLTFTIRQLRKTLGDSAQNPVYIETVSRRGYRFIAEVEKIGSGVEFMSDPETLETANSALEAKTENAQRKRSKNLFIRALVLGALLGSTVIFGAWFVSNKTVDNNPGILNAPFGSEKLSGGGNIFHTVITPDGKNVIYTQKSGGKQGVWIRQLESANNVEIIAASDELYGGIAVSPDGNFLYFSRAPKDGKRDLSIYRVSIFGGVPSKIAEATQGWISVAPDGKKISFVRCHYREDENCSLWIADAADGKNERRIASRPRPYRIADNEISPDGKTVVFAVGQSKTAANEFTLAEVEIETGREREITAERFFDIKSLTQLPDQSGFLITASRIPNKNFLIWHVSKASGKSEPLTNDAQTYGALSLDRAASRLVATNIREDFRLNLLNIENPQDRKILADASTAGFAPDGQIVFSSVMSGNEEIWSVGADGSGQKQLTNDSADDSTPVVSPSDNSIYFASNRTGAVNVWRMNADGSNQTQITNKEGGYPLMISPDGVWIYYHHALDKTLRRVAASGSGDMQMIVDKPAYRFAVAPDTAKAAFIEKKDTGSSLKIFSTADNKIIEEIQPADADGKIPEIAWMPDGKSLVYIVMDKNYENYSLWLHPANGHKPQKIADLGNEEISESSGFAVSPDGRSVIFIQGGWRHDAVLLKGLN